MEQAPSPVSSSDLNPTAAGTNPPSGSLPPALENAVPPLEGTPPPVTSADYGGNRAPSMQVVLLSGIPFVQGTPSLAGLLQAMYRIAIILGAIFAVVRITLAGIQYMGTDSFSSKGEAKKAITEVLIGLLILLSTVLILRTLIGDVDLNTGLKSLPAIGMGPTPGAVVTDNGTVIKVALDKDAGCNQAQNAGGSCQSGSVAVIHATEWGCEASTNISYSPGQTTFKPVTQTACGDIPSIREAVRAGNTIGGVYYATGLNDMTRTEYAKSLETACQSTLPGGVVSSAGNKTYQGKSVFVCAKNPI